MLLKANQKVDSSLRMLRSEPHFQTVLEWLSQSKESLRKDLTECRDEITLRQTQGALQAIEDILSRTNSQ